LPVFACFCLFLPVFSSNNKQRNLLKRKIMRKL
jgi:hypothetical protein